MSEISHTNLSRIERGSGLMLAARIPRIFLFTILCCFLSSCQDSEIVHNLSQRQANEIVALLSEQGIPAQASRGVGSRALYSVQVPANRYGESVAILHYEGLPRIEEPSVSELLSPKGFLPNSREIEGMRVDRAIAAELEAMLKANPAISEVKAIVRRPVFEGVGPQPPAHASLIIRKNPDLKIEREIILGLVANMIPGILQETIVLDIQDSLPITSGRRQGVLRTGDTGKVVSVPIKEFLGWWRVAENDYDRMILVLLGGLLGFLVLGLFVGFSIGFIGKKVVSARPPENLGSLKSDRSTLTLGSSE